MRTLASIIREITLVEGSRMRDSIKQAAIAKLEREAEQLHPDGEIKGPEKDPRQVDIEDPQPGQAAPRANGDPKRCHLHQLTTRNATGARYDAGIGTLKGRKQPAFQGNDNRDLRPRPHGLQTRRYINNLPTEGTEDYISQAESLHGFQYSAHTPQSYGKGR